MKNSTETYQYELAVVVPVYKIRECYLRQCIDSILDQEDIDMQIVLVDDGTPDHCGAICDEYASQYTNISVIHHEKNQGLPAARNTGLKAISSKWVSFVDGDDWVEAKTFSKLLEYIRNLSDEPDVVMFPACSSYIERDIIDPYHETTIWNSAEERNNLQCQALSIPLKVDRPLTYGTAWAKILSVGFLRKYDIVFRDLQYSEDIVFFQEIIESASIVISVDLGMYHYRMTKGSMVHSYRKNAAEEQKKLLDMLWQFANEHRKGTEYYKALHAMTLVSMEVCIVNFYYNKQNHMTLWEKKRNCKKNFSQAPYCNVFHFLNMRDMKHGSQLMSILFMIRQYWLVPVLRYVIMKMKNISFYK